MSKFEPLINYYPIRIPSGWRVEYNNLYVDSPHEGIDENTTIYTISSERVGKAIDVDYRQDESGKFCFDLDVHPLLAAYNEDTDSLQYAIEWEVSLENKQFHDVHQLVQELERLMIQSSEYIDPRIIDRKGRVVEPAESLRLQLVDDSPGIKLTTEILDQKNRKLEETLLACSSITREILEFIQENSSIKKIRNQAKSKLQQKAFRK
jgi:hypothetical protein